MLTGISIVAQVVWTCGGSLGFLTRVLEAYLAPILLGALIVLLFMGNLPKEECDYFLG